MKDNIFSFNLGDLLVDGTSYPVLVLQHLYYAVSQMKAFRSLEASNYFICGWETNLGSKKALDGCVVKASYPCLKKLCTYM